MAKTTRKAKGSRQGNSVANAKKREEAARRRWADVEYRPEMCEMLLKVAGSGASETEMAVYGLGIPRATMRLWVRKYPDFAKVYDLARDVSKAWWEEKGRKNLNRAPFQASVYNKIISCRYRDDYSERMEIAGDQQNPLNVQVIRRVIVQPKGQD